MAYLGLELRAIEIIDRKVNSLLQNITKVSHVDSDNICRLNRSNKIL
jgi:hypothetical protein